MPELTNFIVAGQQRTGTTMLVRTLDQHDNICCRGELFTGIYPNLTRGSYQSHIRQTPQRRARHLFWRSRSIGAYLDEVFAAPRYMFLSDAKWQDCRAFGFKLMYGQARKNPSVLEYVKNRQLPVILLIRRNPLRVLVSLEVRKVTGEPNRKAAVAHPGGQAATTRVKVDAADLLRSLKRFEEKYQHWERLVDSNPCIKLYYEDMVADLPGQLNRVTDFLALPRQPGLEPPTVKLNSAGIADIVTNYDEVVAQLKGTRFEACLAS